MSDLLLDLSRMREARDRIDRTIQSEAFDESGDVYRIASPVRLGFDILKDKDLFRLVGHVATTLRLSCGRCLEEYVLAVDESFDVRFLPHTKNAGDGEVQVEDDDLTTAYYQDQLIDLGQLVQEQLVLAVPMKPLCQDTCRGLCVHCGTNLNEKTCECRPVWVDPRLAALRTFIEPEKTPRS